MNSPAVPSIGDDANGGRKLFPLLQMRMRLCDKETPARKRRRKRQRDFLSSFQIVTITSSPNYTVCNYAATHWEFLATHRLLKRL